MPTANVQPDVSTPPINAKLDALTGSNYTLLPFRQLSLPFQLAIAYYLAVDGEAWELPEASEPKAPLEDNSALANLMPYFITKYGDTSFGVADIPLANLQASVMEDVELAGEYPDWSAYHQWYLSFDDTPRYPETERWPVFLSSCDDETLQDGWHRFHSYARAGHVLIPAVFFPAAQHELKTVCAQT